MLLTILLLQRRNIKNLSFTAEYERNRFPRTFASNYLLRGTCIKPTHILHYILSRVDHIIFELLHKNVGGMGI